MREVLACVLVVVILYAVTEPEKVGEWAGKAYAGYFMASVDAILGAKK